MGINRRRPAPSWYSLKICCGVLHRRPSECHDLPKQRAYEHHGIHRGRMCARPCPGQAHASGGLTVVMLRGLIVLLRIVLFLFLAASFAIAQGGPPYYTNDPGTPGNLNWEINFGYMPFLYSDQSVSYAPDVDINFGVRDRIQLTYENAWLRVKDSSSPAKFGLGQSNPGVKWRFHEGGESGLSISMFPQFFLNNPNDAVRRGITPASDVFLFPLEFSKKL